MRYYFAKTSKGEDFAFDEKEFKDIRRVFLMLGNINNFVNQIDKDKQVLKQEDKWIISRFNSLLQNTIENYNNYEFYKVVKNIEDFLLNDLSRNYIKIIRERSGEVYELLNEIRIGLLKILCPIIPFLCEKIWQDLLDKKIVNEESVHLSLFPVLNNKLINEKLQEDFSNLFLIIEKGLAKRDKEKVGLKWPLNLVAINSDFELNNDLIEVIKTQLNVKNVDFKKAKELFVEFDLKMTPELEAEGYAREFSRHVQAFRKKLGLEKKDIIKLSVITDDKFKDILETQKDFIISRTNSKVFEFSNDKSFENIVDFSIKNQKISIAITKA
jgi:isoleucyl-tRNA synthetase